MIKHKEIVLVRVVATDRDAIVGEVAEMLRELNHTESEISVELYCSMTLPTDFSVHLNYWEPVKKKSLSAIGQHLAEALRKYGLISHSVWTLEPG